ANANVAVSPGGAIGSGADEIRFNIAFGLPRTLSLTQGQLPIRSDLTITGPGSARLTLMGTSTTRVLDVTDFAATQRIVTVSGLSIAGGNAPASSAGGILNRERLTLQNCTVRNNSARDGGGGIA